jgi:hypothetical protein
MATRPKLSLDGYKRVTRKSYDNWKSAVAREWSNDAEAQASYPDVRKYIDAQYFEETGAFVNFQSEEHDAHTMPGRSGGLSLSLSPEERVQHLCDADERRYLLSKFESDPTRFARAAGKTVQEIRNILNPDQRPKTINELREEIAREVCRPDRADTFTAGERIELRFPAGECLSLSATGIARTSGRCFEGVAYGGDIVTSKRGDIAIDLAGIVLPGRKFAAFREHDRNRIAGYIESASVRGGELHVTGKLLAVTDDGKELVGFGDAGFNEQALSIGFDVVESKSIAEAQTCFVNGQALAGPFTLVTKSRLNEISFVAMGADRGAHAIVA